MKFTVIAMLPVALISLLDIYAQFTTTDLNSYWASRLILGHIGALFIFAWLVTCLALAIRSAWRGSTRRAGRY